MISSVMKMPSLVILFVLMACSPQNNHSAAISVEKKAAHVSVNAHQPKPGASVRLESTKPFSLQEAIPADIKLVLLAAETEGVMDVEIGASDELILSSQETMQFQLSPNGRYEVPLKLTAHLAGRYYINLHVSIRAGGQQMSRVLSAIVQVGDEPQLQKAQASDAVSSDDVISLPAQETIIP